MLRSIITYIRKSLLTRRFSQCLILPKKIRRGEPKWLLIATFLRDITFRFNLNLINHGHCFFGNGYVADKLRMMIFPFESFSVSRDDERHVQCAHSPMHLAESAAQSGSSRLHSCTLQWTSETEINIYIIIRRCIKNNFNYCFQQHYH